MDVKPPGKWTCFSVKKLFFLLTKRVSYGKICIAVLRKRFADLAHLVERHLAKVEVASSSLVIRSISGSLAQLGEHLPYKQRVSGSSPLTSTTVAR